jgi:hypothetical protein
MEPPKDHPKKVTDLLQREWSAHLGLPELDAIEEFAGFPLDAIVPKVGAKADADFLCWHEFLADTPRIFDVFHALVKPQADTRGLTKKDVRKGFASDEAAAQMEGATVQAIIDFFHRRNPLRAGQMRTSAEIHAKLMTAGAERANRAMQKLNVDAIVASLPEITTEQIQAATQTAIAQSKKSALSGAATSASTPS